MIVFWLFSSANQLIVIMSPFYKPDTIQVSQVVIVILVDLELGCTYRGDTCPTKNGPQIYDACRGLS